ncbi:MAG: hypothetical protein AAGK22_03350 [Acidobacteriota bacterium]
MSNFAKVVRRLEKERAESAAPEPTAQVEVIAPPQEPLHREAPLPAPPPSLPGDSSSTALARVGDGVVGEGQLTRSGLLDRLRALSVTQRNPIVVVAAASGLESVRPLSYALVQQAFRRSLDVTVAEMAMEGGSRVLRETLKSIEDSELMPKPVKIGPLDFNAADPRRDTASVTLDVWLAQASTRHDLLLIEGPPLSTSVDAALLARRCDGLILVAESERTPREVLRAASERAQAAGCNVVGVVLSGSKDWLPRWVNRILRELF